MTKYLKYNYPYIGASGAVATGMKGAVNQGYP